ncbi:hypothetical protein, partial [Paenibacillus sp. IHB B 3415]|uniref:hypothetical protein n=1 Tax=Paenibacillus sp. IHB B 3415 TaxID=867080 RepID=UPI0035A10CBC
GSFSGGVRGSFSGGVRGSFSGGVRSSFPAACAAAFPALLLPQKVPGSPPIVKSCIKYNISLNKPT